MNANDLALGLRILADLLESGLSVGAALNLFAELAPRGWQPAVASMRRAIREGRSFATAMAEAPVAIPPVVVGIARAGEAGTGLASAMRRAAELAERSAETRAAVRAALAYPMLVAFAGAGAIIVLVTVVLPRFAKILADLGQTLPASTRAVLALARVAQVAFIPATIAIVVVVSAWRGWIANDAGRATWHRWLRAAPLLGEWRAAAASARMAASLAALLDSGIAMSPALALTAPATGDADAAQRLLRARERVAHGDSLSKALDGVHGATTTTIRLVRAGEESGRLVRMLEHAAHIEHQRVDRLVRAGVRMLEPLLLLVFATLVAGIAAALLQAVYSVRPTA